jgi:hypothetical protein
LQPTSTRPKAHYQQFSSTSTASPSSSSTQAETQPLLQDPASSHRWPQSHVQYVKSRQALAERPLNLVIVVGRTVVILVTLAGGIVQVAGRPEQKGTIGLACLTFITLFYSVLALCIHIFMRNRIGIFGKIPWPRFSFTVGSSRFYIGHSSERRDRIAESKKVEEVFFDCMDTVLGTLLITFAVLAGNSSRNEANQTYFHRLFESILVFCVIAV